MLSLRITYFVLFTSCTALALTTRWHPNYFHPLFAKYAGDILWAGMFVFLFRIFFSKTQLWKVAIGTYLLGVADELLQLYHAPWIEEIRKTKIGWMLLGYGFMWSDIICYAIGVAIAYLVVIFLEQKLFKK